MAAERDGVGAGRKRHHPWAEPHRSGSVVPALSEVERGGPEHVSQAMTWLARLSVRCPFSTMDTSAGEMQVSSPSATWDMPRRSRRVLSRTPASSRVGSKRFIALALVAEAQIRTKRPYLSQ